MNLKKLCLPVMCCCAAFLSSCGNLPSGYQEVGYEDAVTFVKNQFGEGTDEAKYAEIKSVSCEWIFGGIMEDWGKNPANILNPDATHHYLPTHLSSFLNKYTGISATDVFKTYKYDLNHASEFSLNSNGVITIKGEDFKGYTYPTLDAKHFDNSDENVDNVLRYFVSNVSKYSARYTINPHNKSFKINCTYVGYSQNQEYAGDDVLVLPSLTIDFNNTGTIKSIVWDFTYDQLCSYTWITDNTKTSDKFSWNMYKGSYIAFHFEY